MENSNIIPLINELITDKLQKYEDFLQIEQFKSKGATTLNQVLENLEKVVEPKNYDDGQGSFKLTDEMKASIQKLINESGSRIFNEMDKKINKEVRTLEKSINELQPLTVQI